MVAINRISRFKGCMMGAAIGDSMGMPVETLSRNMIIKRYGRIENLMPLKTRKTLKPAGSWTDETHMMMLTAKSIIEKQAINIQHLTDMYVSALDQNFGIAGTTKKALELRKQGEDIWSLNKGRHSGGGAAARMAPVALFEYNDLQSLLVKADAVARITHQDHDAVAGAVGIAFIIAKAVRRELFPKTILQEFTELMKKMNSSLSYNMKLVKELLHSDMEAEGAIEEIGSDGTTMRLIPSALFAFLKTPNDFEKTILSAVNAGGDTDSRAAIAGSISGAYNGIDCIPRKWANKIYNCSMILSFAEKLYLMPHLFDPALSR